MERRKYIRIEGNYSFNYKVYQHIDFPYDVAKIIDVSAGGMRIVTSNQLAPNSILELNVREPFAKKRLVLLGKVLTCTKAKKELFYKTRIEFVYLDEKKQAILQDVVRELEQGQDAP